MGDSIGERSSTGATARRGVTTCHAERPKHGVLRVAQTVEDMHFTRLASTVSGVLRVSPDAHGTPAG